MSTAYSAIPRRFSAKELALRPDSACALCGTRETDISIQRDWVLCPLVSNKAICLGCCLDYQGLARATDFATDVYRGLFDDLARRMDRSVDELRLVCLNHQQEIIGEQLRDATPTETQELLSLAARVSGVAVSIRPQGTR